MADNINYGSGNYGDGVYPQASYRPYLVQDIGGNSGSTTVSTGTFNINVTNGATQGDYIIVVAATTAGTITSVTDDVGDTYNLDASGSWNTTGTLYIFSTHIRLGGIVAGDNITVHMSTGCSAMAEASEYANVWNNADSIDKSASANGTSTSPNSGNTPTVLRPDELIIGGAVVLGANDVTPTSGLFNLTRITGASSVARLTPMYQIQGPQAAYSVSGTSSNLGWGAIVATYFSPASSTPEAASSTITPSNLATRVATYSRSASSTVVVSTIGSKIVTRAPVQVVGNITIRPTFSWQIVSPSQPDNVRDKLTGGRQEVYSISDNRIRISNLHDFDNGFPRDNTNTVVKYSLSDKTGTILVSNALLTYDTNQPYSFYQDVAASVFGNGGAPWLFTLNVFDESATVLDSTFEVLCQDTPLVHVPLRGGSANSFHLINVQDGGGNLLPLPWLGSLYSVGNYGDNTYPPINYPVTVTITRKNGTVLGGPTNMDIVNPGEYLLDMPGTGMNTGTDPWFATIIVYDPDGITKHITIRLVGTDLNRV